MYVILKLIHILAVVVFVGNIVTGAFWKGHADRSGDPRIIAQTVDGIRRSDRWFTIPGVTVLVLAGLGTAGVGHIPILSTGWILWSLVLIIISGIAFGAAVAPLQVKMAHLLRDGIEQGSIDWTQYRALGRQWAMWGGIATLAPLIAIALMVLKPALPAL